MHSHLPFAHNSINIRSAKNSDATALEQLLIAHAQYEGQQLVINQQTHQLKALELLPIDIFVVEAEIEVEIKKKLLGYMSLAKQYSTWEMDWYLYLDCLYLAPELRGQGLGKKLMLKAASFAKTNGINQMQWQTPNTNKNAIGFYHNLGATSLNKKRFFWQLSGC